jgi:hypothetical protein
MTRHLYVHAPRILVTGQVNDSFDPNTDYPAGDVPIKSVTVIDGEDFLDVVRPGMTVIFGTAPGLDDLGRQRIRRVFNDDDLLLGYSPRGTLDGEFYIAPDDYFAILDDRRVWAKTQRFVRQEVEPFVIIYKDYDNVFASQGAGTQFHPKANAGPARAGTVNAGTGLLTVELPGPRGHASYSMPAGVGITGYLWDVGDGTITVGTATSASITATFPAGFRYVSLRVEDDDGLQHTMEIPVLARDPDDDICVADWQEIDFRTTAQGQNLRVRLLSDLPRLPTTPASVGDSAAYDGVPVLYFDDDDDDHHCLFYGWHHHDPASVEVDKYGFTRGTELECLDLLGKLNTLPGQAVTIRNADTPANWGEMYHPGMYQFIDHLLRWHSTALELADWSWPEFEVDYAFIERECDADTFLRQVDEQAVAIVPDHSVNCNKLGQLQLRVQPQVQTLFSRTSVEQADVTNAIVRVSVVHQRPPRVREVRASAMVEGWEPVEGPAVEVRYSIRPTAFADVGATTINVYAIPVDIADDAILYLVGLEGVLLPWVTMAAAATAGATTLTVEPLDDTVDLWSELVYITTEPGPSVVPTVHCIAPGLTHGQGETAMTLNGKIAQNQGGLNSMVGHYYARVNAEYGLVDVELVGEDDMGIETADMDWVVLGPLPPRIVPQRLLPFFTQEARYLPLEITRRYDHRATGTVITVTVRLERETSGPPAVTVTGDEI